MKKTCLTSFFTGAVGLLFISPSVAGVPLWIFSAPNPASVTVSSGGTATVQYTVTNQSNVSKNLILKPTPGLSASSCTLATRGSTCALTLTVNGSSVPATGIHSGPVLCEQSNPNQCYQPKQENTLSVNMSQGGPILSSSVSNLALSVTGLPVPSGKSRIITITNSGDSPAAGLSLSFPAWPTGTQVGTASTCVNGGTLAANGGSCTIVIEPGAAATSNCSTTGTEPNPGAITVSANSGILSTSIDVVVLNYGCIYQEGYIYSIDDTTPDTVSIGGNVVALTDQAPRFPFGVIWSSDSSGAFDGGVAIYGIAETSTPSSPVPAVGQIAGQLACNGRTDGTCNSNNIIVYYSPPQTNPAITSSFYAAGRCSAYSVGIYADWYLPAICEMGPASGGSGCVAGTQNIVTNLPTLLGDPNFNPDTSCLWGVNCLSGDYWSSTEYSVFPITGAWLQEFASGGNSFQAFAGKNDQAGVRCSRALTP